MPASGSTQGWVAATLTTTAATGQVVAVAAADGSVVARYVVPVATSSIVLAADGIENAQAYTLLVGDADGATGFSTGGSTKGLTAADTVTAGQSSVQGGGGPGGGGPGAGGRGDGQPNR